MSLFGLTLLVKFIIGRPYNGWVQILQCGQRLKKKKKICLLLTIEKMRLHRLPGNIYGNTAVVTAILRLRLTKFKLSHSKTSKCCVLQSLFTSCHFCLIWKTLYHEKEIGFYGLQQSELYKSKSWYTQWNHWSINY